eukprot:11195630-Lingulodinium_polyedra.AAC.1
MQAARVAAQVGEANRASGQMARAIAAPQAPTTSLMSSGPTRQLGPEEPADGPWAPLLCFPPRPRSVS